MNQPVIDATYICPPLLPLAQSRRAWCEMNIGSDLWYWDIVIKNDKSGFEVLDEWEWARKGKKREGKTVIEFCKDKCWNVCPYWMQLAVGFCWMRIIMKKNRKQTDVGRRTEDLHLISPCVKSSLPTPHIFNWDSMGFFTWRLAAWHANRLHTQYKY